MAQYIYGKNVCIQRLKDGKPIRQMYLLDGIKDQELEKLANKRGVLIEKVNRKKLDTLSKGGRHQGIMLVVDDYKTVSVDEILSRIPQDKKGLLVMLDQLEDPHNLGAVLRTCDAVGADGVIIRKNNSVGLNATVAKVSTGAIDTIPVAEVSNLSSTLEDLKKKGYWVYGTDAKNAVDYRSPAYDTPVVLVIGSEGKGISRLVKEHCDQMVSLPMVGEVTSLNASVACAILLYQIHSKRFPL